MILITVGSQKFQFNRLLKALDQLAESGKLTGEIFAQTGYSDYQPVNYPFQPFIMKEEMERLIDRADLVITHAGTAAIIGPLKKGKKVIVVPRRACFGEHVDDHQLEISEQFKELNLILCCEDCDKLGDCLEQIKNMEFSVYQSRTREVMDDISQYLQSL